MGYGYQGKILRVNLGSGDIDIEEQDEHFYRTYMGGRNIGAYYLLRELNPNTDPLGPDNIIVFSASVITGAPIPGLGRFSVVAKSPLTGTYGEGEAGGYFGPELKFAGFDAIVIKGKSPEPIYLWIYDGQAELKSATHLWGKDTLETQTTIREELSDPRIRVAQIGIAGENQVRFACVISDLKHAVGRTGMGAVMGSKNLKAIAVRGTEHKIPLFDREAVREITKAFNKEYGEYTFLAGQADLGTAQNVTPLNAMGMLPTRNFKQGVFEGADSISGETIKETILIGQEGCFACPVKCKKIVKLEEPQRVDPSFGSPEYETIAMLGSNCGVDNLAAIAKGNELCSRYTLDTISTGSMIAFAMECFEEGIISKEDTGGIELNFGNADAMLKLIDMIARRQAIGNILADGPLKAKEKFGKRAEDFVMQVKGQPLPAHEPRGKVGVGISYAIAPQGADHTVAEHDTCFSSETYFLKHLYPLGIIVPVPARDLSSSKIRLYTYLQQIYSLYNVLDICIFAGAPLGALKLSTVVKMVETITGWETSLWELMKVGERGINLTRVFNVREGFSSKDDILPDRIFEPLPSGPLKGVGISKGDFKKALATYYEMMGWDAETGIPKGAKLEELNIGWVRKTTRG